MLMAQPVIALFESKDMAVSAIHDLKAAGFPERAIGLITPDGRDNGRQHRIVDSATPDPQSSGTAGAAAGAVIGGTLGAVLAATGALLIPGVGPFITGGILASLVGGAAGWLVGGLAAMDIPREEAAYYEVQVQRGRTLVTVLPEGREILATDILRRHGGDTSARDADLKQPATMNHAQSSGQMRDMMRSTSDDGTVPPTAIREAITTPEQGGSDTLLRTGGTGDYPRSVATPEMRPYGSVRAQNDAGAQPASGNHEAPGSGDIGLSPEDPRRDSDEGQPYLDDANPYGSDIENREGEPMGGSGTPENPADPALQTEREQPGASGANPLPHALDPEPFRPKSKGPESKQ
jgi:hypothetical protein